jgi:hypothetical protein
LRLIQRRTFDTGQRATAGRFAFALQIPLNRQSKARRALLAVRANVSRAASHARIADGGEDFPLMGF